MLLLPVILLICQFLLSSLVGQVSSQLSLLRKFSKKYHFPAVNTGAETLDVHIQVFNLSTPDPYVSINMTRVTHVHTNDQSNRHFPVRFAPYNMVSLMLRSHDRELPLDYFVKGRNLIVTSESQLEGSPSVTTTGYRAFQMANQGLDFYFLETTLGKKQFVAFTALYPLRATDLFFGVHHNKPVPVFLKFTVPKGYDVITASGTDGHLEAVCRISEIAAALMPGSVEIRRNDDKLRIVADTLQNKTFDTTYLPFASLAAKVHKELAAKMPELVKERVTLVVVPLLNRRPLTYGCRICLFDAHMVANEPQYWRYLLTLCYVHQQMTLGWTGGEDVFYYMFEGLREFFTIKLLNEQQQAMGDALLMKYFVQILNSDDHRLTATVIARRDLQYVSAPSIIYKTVIFLNMLESAFNVPMKFLTLVQRMFDKKNLFITDTFCSMFERHKLDMNYPNDTVHFCSVYDRWTSSVGYPILMTFVEPGKRRIYITNSVQSELHEPYAFPFRYAVVREGDKTYTVLTAWLMSNVEPFTINTSGGGSVKYFFCNPDARGLYRMNYDVDNWRRLIKHGAELSPGTKVTMIVDAFYFYKELNLHIDICLQSLLLLKSDTTHVVWEAVDYVLNELELLFRDSSLYNWYLSFMGKLVGSYYHHYGLKAPVGVRFGCKAGIRSCLKGSWLKLREYVIYRNVMPSREAVLCAGMRSASREYFVYLEHLVAKKDRHRNVLLVAMTCFEDEPLLRRLLYKIFLRNEFRLSDNFSYQLYLHMIVATPHGWDAAWRFFVKHHKRLQKTYRVPLMQHLVDTLAKSMVSKKHWRTMRAVLRSMRVGEARTMEILTAMRYRHRLLAATFDQLKDIFRYK